MKPWKRISSYKAKASERVTLWLDIYASPMSMGWADAYAVADCWREDGRWLHIYKGKPAVIKEEYVTHFAPAGAVLSAGPDGETLDWWRG